jgi:hypothetical protein
MTKKTKPKIKRRYSRCVQAYPKVLDAEEFSAAWNELLSVFAESNDAFVARGRFETDRLTEYAGQRLAISNW